MAKSKQDKTPLVTRRDIVLPGRSPVSLATTALDRIEQASAKAHRSNGGADIDVKIIADGTDVRALVRLQGMTVELDRGTVTVDITATQE